MSEHTLETDVIELRAQYDYVTKVVEKTSIQVDAIQHQTNKIPLLVQSHENLMKQIGQMQEGQKHLEKDHYELKSEFKSWLNKGLGGWVVVALVWSYVYSDFKEKWADMRNDIKANTQSSTTQQESLADITRRLKAFEEAQKAIKK